MAFIYPYKTGSRSAKALSEETGWKRIKRTNSKFKPGPGKTVVNWGSSSLPDHILEFECLNHPSAVARACNKLDTFKSLENTRTPRWTESREEATGWGLCLARTVLCGHSGAGIVLAEGDELPDAPLYVQYVSKKDEYRVHVLGGEVFFVQRKARKLDVPDSEVNWKIRNHQNGFIFANQEVQPPEDVLTQAVQAIQDLSLDFGAVDIGFNSNEGKAYVYEVNTSPGLEGTTVLKYAEALKRIA